MFQSPNQKSLQLTLTSAYKIDDPVGLFVKTLMPPLQGKQNTERKKKKRSEKIIRRQGLNSSVLMGGGERGCHLVSKMFGNSAS